MDLQFLRDRAFRVFRTNQLPPLTTSHRDFITSLVAQYYYTKYTNTTGDLIPKYNSPEDVHVTANIEKFELQGLSLLHLLIEHGSAVQTVAFIGKNEKYAAFIRLHFSLFLTEALESLDLETPLALQPLAISHDFITNCANGLGDLVNIESSMLGQIDMKFAPDPPLTGNSLREIAISVPKEDTKYILQGSELPLTSLHDWLTKTTSLRFENIKIAAFSCSVVAMRSNTILILCSLDPETTLISLLSIILECVHR
ncbi:hypothetical protein METSCH_D04150 [Metschnikowia aff. pulcherrima]|uniref:Uncharacterized protein n=1 Tax=Metschnikowia aff. pulcherrima TaxID=2163413 RepID=A0A4P6XRI2_9ASCO|nr:hypothetical protein METSCH_D04150 [Metschnikowia aff. pulcherrima]